MYILYIHVYKCIYIHTRINSNYPRRIENKQKNISYKNTVYDLVTFKAEH